MPLSLASLVSRSVRNWPPMRRQANSVPAILSQPSGFHRPVESARGLLPVSSVTIPQPQQDRRKHGRTRVLCPVVVEAGTSRYRSHAADISTHGAKVSVQRMRDRWLGIFALVVGFWLGVAQPAW